MKDDTWIGESPVMERLRDSIARAAPTEMPVLIQGETGTGKELAARAIHRQSRRSRAPFVAVNCAGMPETLIESELFGHVKGAFTGADTTRKGKFELADNGTIFLDEIGEIASPVQAKLLRVLEEREVDPLGSSRSIAVDFRLVSATNRNLRAMIREGKFREDLYYRISVEVIRTPALRERACDIAELARHFAIQFGRQRLPNVEDISPAVVKLLEEYPWPGNVRELRNVMQRAAAGGEGVLVEVHDLPQSFFESSIVENTKPEGSYDEIIGEVSRRVFAWALTATKGNIKAAAALLGMNRSTFYRHAWKLGLRNLLHSSASPD